MKKIKICIVSLYAYHLFNQANISKFGGAEVQLYLLATELAKDPRFEVCFIVGDFGQPEFEIKYGIKLYRFFNPATGLKYIRAIGGFIRLWRLLDKINADILIQRAAGFETAEVGFYSGITHCHFCYMVAHDSDINKQKPNWQDGWIGTCRWWLFRLGLRSAELVFTQHEDQDRELRKNYLRVRGIIRRSAHIIPTNIDMAKKKYVLWVARCEDWKDPEKYLDLVEAFPKQEFVMVMPESNDKDYYNRTKQKALSIPNLKLVDFVPFDHIDEYFFQASVFVNTSKTEGFPNTFIQAAKTKTPILSLIVDPDNMLEKNKIGICAKGDFTELQAGLEKLLSNKEFREETGENGYNYAKQKHDLLKIVEKDKELFLELIQNKT